MDCNAAACHFMGTSTVCAHLAKLSMILELCIPSHCSRHSSAEFGQGLKQLNPLAEFLATLLGRLGF